MLQKVFPLYRIGPLAKETCDPDPQVYSKVVHTIGQDSEPMIKSQMRQRASHLILTARVVEARTFDGQFWNVARGIYASRVLVRLAIIPYKKGLESWNLGEGTHVSGHVPAF